MNLGAQVSNSSSKRSEPPSKGIKFSYTMHPAILANIPLPALEEQPGRRRSSSKAELTLSDFERQIGQLYNNPAAENHYSSLCLLNRTLNGTNELISRWPTNGASRAKRTQKPHQHKHEGSLGEKGVGQLSSDVWADKQYFDHKNITSNIVNLEDLREKLAQFSDIYLGNKQDKLNLISYLNDKHIEQCNFDEFLSDISRNLISKLSNLEIKQKLLSYIRRLYSVCDVDNELNNPSSSRPLCNGTNHQEDQIITQLERNNCNRDSFNSTNNLDLERYNLVYASKPRRQFNFPVEHEKEEQEFGRLSLMNTENFTATEQWKLSAFEKDLQLLGGPKSTFNDSLKWQLNSLAWCEHRAATTAALHNSQGRGNKLRNLSSSFQQKQLQEKEPIHPTGVCGDYDSTNCGRRAEGVDEKAGTAGGGSFVIVGRHHQSKGSASLTTTSNNNLHPADNNNNNNSIKTASSINNSSSGSSSNTSSSCIRRGRGGGGRRRRRQQSLDKFALEGRSSSVTPSNLTSNKDLFELSPERVASFSARAQKTGASHNEAPATLMEDICLIANARERDSASASISEFNGFDIHREHKIKGPTDGLEFFQKQEVMSSCSSSPHQRLYSSYQQLALAQLKQRRHQQQLELNLKLRSNDDELIQLRRQATGQVHENDYQHHRNFRLRTNKEEEETSVNFQPSAESILTACNADTLLYLDEEENAYNNTDSINNNNTRNNQFSLAQTIDPEIHSNSMLFGNTNDHDNYSANGFSYQHQRRSLRQNGNPSFQPDLLLDDQDPMLSLAKTGAQQLLSQQNIGQEKGKFPEGDTRLQHYVGPYSRLLSNSSKPPSSSDALFTSHFPEHLPERDRPVNQQYLAIGKSPTLLPRWFNDDLNLCTNRENGLLQQGAHHLGCLSFVSSIQNLRGRAQSVSLGCLPGSLEEEETENNSCNYQCGYQRHHHQTQFHDLADSATRCLLDTSSPDSTALSTSSSLSLRARWRMNKAITSNHSYFTGKRTPPIDYYKLDDQIKLYQNTAEKLEEEIWPQQRFAQTTICDQCSCHEPPLTNTRYFKADESNWIDCAFHEPLHTSVPQPQPQPQPSFSFGPLNSQLTDSPTVYQPHHQIQYHDVENRLCEGFDNKESTNGRWHRTQSIEVNPSQKMKFPLLEPNFVHGPGTINTKFAPPSSLHLSRGPDNRHWVTSQAFNQQLNQPSLTPQAQHFQNHQALVGVQVNPSLPLASHSNQIDLRDSVVEMTAPSNGISAFHLPEQAQAQPIVPCIQTSLTSDKPQVENSRQQRVTPSSGRNQRSHRRQQKRHQPKPSSSLALTKHGRDQSNSFKSEDNLFNGEQYNDNQDEEDAANESDSGLSFVVSRRIPNSIIEQMGEEATNFVQHHGSTNTHMMRKENVRLRRTIPVKIKKSKPILGIAIEGGFNVSGQLLPRIVCVHEDGAAYQCGKLRASDLILEVNGKSTVNMTHDQIAETIANAYYKDPRSHIEFLIGESGYVSK